MTALRLILVAIACVIPIAAFAAHTHAPAPSTWNLNVKASDFGGAPAPRSDIDKILADDDHHLHWEDVTVDGSGQTSKTSWDGPEDGTSKPIVGLPGSQFSWDTATDTERAVYADGSMTEAVFTVSPDQKRMTFKQTLTTKGSKTVVHQTMIYDRVR